jgi:hypothetical protein
LKVQISHGEDGGESGDTDVTVSTWMDPAQENSSLDFCSFTITEELSKPPQAHWWVAQFSHLQGQLTLSSYGQIYSMWQFYNWSLDSAVSGKSLLSLVPRVRDL